MICCPVAISSTTSILRLQSEQLIIMTTPCRIYAGRNQAKKKRPLSDFERGSGKPKLKYEERHAGVCAYLCISIVNFRNFPDFARRLLCSVLSIGIGLRATALRQLTIARWILPERQKNYIIKPPRPCATVRKSAFTTIRLTAKTTSSRKDLRPCNTLHLAKPQFGETQFRDISPRLLVFGTDPILNLLDHHRYWHFNVLSCAV